MYKRFQRYFLWATLTLATLGGAFMPSKLHAQAFFLEKLPSEKGLSHQNITCLLQDQRGFLWIGTQEGLLRYDGYDAALYPADIHTPHALPSNEITALYQDALGTLWVGTAAGLSKYNWELDRFETFTEGLSYTKVKAIVAGNGQMLCIGTQLGGVYTFDTQTKIFTPIAPELPAFSVTSLAADRRLILAGTDKRGVQFLDKNALVYKANASQPSLASVVCSSLLFDKKGQLWLGTFGEGLYRLDESLQVRTDFSATSNAPSQMLPNNFINALAQDKEGNIWIGTSSGLAIYDTKLQATGQVVSSNSQVEASAMRVNALLTDTLGIVWIGTDNGLFFFDPLQEKFYAKGREKADWDLLGNLNIQAIAPWSDGSIWLGTKDGLVRMNAAMTRSTIFKTNNSCLTSTSITALASRKNDLWVGTENSGIVVWNPDGKACKTFQQAKNGAKGISSDHITQLLADEDGVWIATEGGGINRWHALADTFAVYRHQPNNPQSISADFITCLAQSRTGALWVGSYGGGIDRLWEGSTKVDHFKSAVGDTASLNSNLVTALYEDTRGALWVGTQIGLSLFDAEKQTFRVIQLTTSKGNCLIKAITEDHQGNIWVSSNQGIFKYDMADGMVEHYDEKDGIIGKQFSDRAVCNAIGNGVIAFGCDNGLVYFNPQNIYENKFEPPVYLSQIHVNNQLVPVAAASGFSIERAIWGLETLVLGPNESFFAFEFIALNLRLPEKNRYRYRLDPLQKDWIYKDAGRREATYTNLPAGEYTFMVQGSNNDGVWNPKVTTLNVIIEPPLWKTTWMRTIFVFAILGLAWWIYNMRVRRIERLRRELEEKVAMRTQELFEKSQELAQKADELAMQKEEIMQINDQLGAMNEQLGEEKKKSEEMLLNILPKETAKELQEKGFYTPRHYKNVSVLFTDFKSFTSIAESMTPKELIEELDYFFQYFDNVVDKHNLEKIKTIGDAYMCAGGIPKPNHTNAIDAVLAGLEIVAFTQRVNQERVAKGQKTWELRVGINSGELVAGVVGKRKFAYDIWGDAVNLASRMESSGEVGKVNISEITYNKVKDFFVCNHRGQIHAKGKGEVDMYIVERIKPELSLDGDGLSPNARFREMVKEMMMEANSLLHKPENMQDFPTELFKKARGYVKNLLETSLPAHVVYHNWPHTWEVTEAAIEIGIAEGLGTQALEKIALAAIFHDTGHTVDYGKHEEFSLKIMQGFLLSAGVSQKFIEEVKDIINATIMPQKPINDLQRIMCDADLFYLTSDQFEEKSQLLRQEWGAQFNRTYTNRAWITQNIGFLESHQYFTNYGKEVLEAKKQAIIIHQKELLLQT